MYKYSFQDKEPFNIIPDGDSIGKTEVDLPPGEGGDGSRQPASIGWKKPDGNSAEIIPPETPQNPKNN